MTGDLDPTVGTPLGAAPGTERAADPAVAHDPADATVTGPADPPLPGARRRRRVPWALLLLSAVGIGAIAVLVSYRTEPEVPVPAADISRAVAAVEARLGGNQRFTEINATPDGVNLFVVQADGQERAWFYAHGALDGPGASAPPAAPTFTLEGVDTGLAVKIARGVVAQFPGSQLTRFALVQQQGQLIWSARAVSSKGGTIEAYFTPDGKTLGGALK